MTVHATIHVFSASIVAGWCICGLPLHDKAHGFTPAPEPQAVARRGDPDTSWQAARSISSDRIRRSQMEVLALFQQHGPMTDEMAASNYSGTQSPSGLRTRRSELVDQGVLIDSGYRRRGSTGRQMIVWEINR